MVFYSISVVKIIYRVSPSLEFPAQNVCHALNAPKLRVKRRRICECDVHSLNVDRELLRFGSLGVVDVGEGGGDVPAAVELFAGLGEEAVEEFCFAALYPAGGAADAAADEVEGCSYTDDDAAGQVGG